MTAIGATIFVYGHLTFFWRYCRAFEAAHDLKQQKYSDLPPFLFPVRTRSVINPPSIPWN